MRQEKVWRDCERVGEQQVMLNLASSGIWSPTSSEWHEHAKNWLLAQNWKRSRSTEVAAKRASQAAWFSGGDGVQPPRAYFNLDWSLKRVSRFGQKNRPRDRCSPQGASATLLSPDVCYWHKADSLSGLASRPLFAVKETSLLDIAIYVCAS